MITVLADDLSGAQEALAAVTALGPEPAASAAGRLVLDPHARLAPAPDALAMDLDVRGLAPVQAAAVLDRAVDALGGAGRLGPWHRVLVKIDSLLRGNIGVLADAAARRAPVVLCPAVPPLGRTTIGGVVHVHGVPLHRGELWQAETAAPPATIAQLLPARRRPPLHAGLRLVRGGGLRTLVGRAGGRVIVADAETDEDCRRIVEDSPGAILLGAGGLARALADGAPTPTDGHEAPPLPAPRRAPVTVVVGSIAPGTRAQVAALEEDGVPVVRWAPGATVPPSAEDRVLLLDAPLDPHRAEHLAAAFADAVARTAGDDHLVLTGGQTARMVLDRLRVSALTPVAQPHHGAVVALTDDGRLVATRPGSFGDADSLRLLRTALHDLRTHHDHQHPSSEGIPS